MTPVRALAVFSAVLLSTVGAFATGDADLLVWIDDEGNEVWSVSRQVEGWPQDDAHATDLLAPKHFAALPDIRVPMLDGGEFDLKSARGRVLLIDFWASWCAPCLVELPQLQKLHDAEKNRGLVAIAINTQEADSTIRATAEAMGLALPIGKYDSAVDAAFRVRSLPTVILADRDGRIRARWDGYAPGLEEAIAKHTRELLGEDAEGAARPIARVTRGAERLEVMWSRRTGVPIEGLLIVPAPDGSPGIVAVGRGQLHAIAPNGDLIGKRPAPAGAGRIALARSKKTKRSQIVGYRSAGEELVAIDSATAESHAWPAPATLLDVAVAPSSDGSDHLYLATLGGLYRADPLGGSLELLGAEKRTRAAAATETGLYALREGVVERVGADGAIAVHAEVDPDAWRLVTAPRVRGGVGVVPKEVNAAAGLGIVGGAGQVALATRSGELLIVDLADGEASIRAGWRGIGALAAGDLDGDGRDELLVAGKRRLTALRVRPAPAKSLPVTPKM
jgi:thiol-disulfide isomerase/thioredoxin